MKNQKGARGKCFQILEEKLRKCQYHKLQYVKSESGVFIFFTVVFWWLSTSKKRTTKDKEKHNTCNTEPAYFGLWHWTFNPFQSLESMFKHLFVHNIWCTLCTKLEMIFRSCLLCLGLLQMNSRKLIRSLSKNVNDPRQRLKNQM